MKKLILPILAIAALISLPIQMFGQEVTVGATVLAQGGSGSSLTLSAGEMNFGSFTPSADEAGTVVLDTLSDRGNSTFVDLGIAEGLACACTVSGTHNVNYTVTEPSGVNITNTAEGHDETMAVSGFTISGSVGFGETRNSGGDGEDGFNIGASLAVGANQEAGDYTGTFSLNISYD